MPAPTSPAPLEPLREAVRRAVERSSVLATASSIGMSAPGLRNFLAGGTPRRSTFRKLTSWYVRQAASDSDVSDETVQAALALMLDGVPERGQRDATRMVLDTLRAAFEKHGTPIPSWLDRLQQRHGGETRST